MFFFHKLLPAMSSRDDPLVVDQRAATVMVADVDGNLPWLRVGCTFIATHNLVICRGWSYESNMNKKRNRQLKLLTNQQEMKADKLLDWIFGLFFLFSDFLYIHKYMRMHADLFYLQRLEDWTKSGQSSCSGFKPGLDMSDLFSPCIYTYSLVSFHTLRPITSIATPTVWLSAVSTLKEHIQVTLFFSAKIYIQ